MFQTYIYLRSVNEENELVETMVTKKLSRSFLGNGIIISINGEISKGKFVPWQEVKFPVSLPMVHVPSGHGRHSNLPS